MKKYIINSSILINSDGKQFRRGSVVTESDLRGKNIAALLQRNNIAPYFKVREITGKIKLAIVTSIWGRPEIVELFMKGVDELRKNCPEFDIQVVVSGSIQDEERIKYKGKEFGCLLNNTKSFFKYIEIPNEPLAAKVNATTYACRNLDVDYVMCVGSDDIMSPEFLNAYIPYMRNNIDFIGVTDGYFYDTVSKKSLYWAGYREENRKGHTLGAFRALSSRLLSQWDWMPWENKDSAVLDKSMQDKLKRTAHTIETFTMKEKGVIGVDIKSSTNMTPFKKWDNAEFIDSEIILNKFPYVRN
jgi:hypothetical protein